jgi:hypothetical protein
MTLHRRGIAIMYLVLFSSFIAQGCPPRSHGLMIARSF